MNKILFSPFTRIIIGAIVVVAMAALGQFISNSLLKNVQINKIYADLITSIVIAIMALTSYVILFRYYEKRRITELGLSFFGKNAGIGLVIGLLLQSLVIFVMFAYGSYTILRVNPISYILPGFAIALSSAVFEELLFRGILFRLLEEKLGSIISLFISALIFGLLHLANKNSNLYSALSIAIQAGILLAAAFIYSRNLWLPIALHFAWNFAETSIFGAIISGNQNIQSLFSAKVQRFRNFNRWKFWTRKFNTSYTILFSCGNCFFINFQTSE